ncbi:MAG: TIGR03016 family PEP-CTERM system-associated outer membrane protein [Alphaproteobacteria bacterium]|nr:TIGR03016 family PEP-CTERM system-associated outer membrane protein [Alphaproteobacteria bacterium]
MSCAAPRPCGGSPRHRAGGWRLRKGLLAAYCLAAVLPRGAAHAQDAGGASSSSSSSSSSSGPSALMPAAGGTLLNTMPAEPGSFAGYGSSSGLVPGTSLRDQIAQALGLQAPGASNAPGFVFTPALLLSQQWISNAGISNGDNSSAGAFITHINPSVSIAANTSRIQGNFVYAPDAIIYEGAGSGGQDRIAQNLAGNAHITLLPDQLFLDLKAFGTEQSIFGGFGPPGTTQLSNQQAAQTYSVSANPYLMHRFDTFGTAELGGLIGATSQAALSNTVQTVPGQPATFTGDQHSLETQEYAAFASGDDFGRWVSNAAARFTQYTGTGVLDGAWDNSVTYEGGYALTRQFTVLATVGWEDLHYNSIPPVDIDDGLWNIGFRYTPNPDSTILFRYGRQQGLTGPFVQATYAPGSHSRLFANYSLTLSTDQQQLAQGLASATFDPLGNPTDATTGAPLLLANNFFGIQTSVYRLEQASAGGTILFDRDTFLVSVNQQRRKPVGSAPGGPAPFEDTGTYGAVHWQHDLSEAFSLGAYLQYGELTTTTDSVRQTTDLLVGTATLNWLVTATLNAQLLYSHTADLYTSGGAPGTSSDLVMVSMRKTF